MENFLRKYGWTLVLAVIAIGASLLALTANNLVASQLAPYTVPELPDLKTAPKPDLDKGAPKSKNWDRTIAQLCLFGCPEAEPGPDECVGGCEPGERCESGQCVPVEDQPPVDSNIPVLSDLSIKLMGAMVSAQKQHSMALLRDDGSSETMVAGVGDYIADDAELIEIRRDRVIIKRGGRLEYIRMDKSIGGAPSATAQATPTSTLNRSATPSPALARPKSSSSTGEAVKKVSENRFEVERSAIEEQIDDKKALARQGRVVPNYKNGKRDGLKLVGISPNSVYSQLGIQSGDVIHSVNGKQITTSQQAMELFEQMKTQGKVSVEVERRGQKRRMEYQIR
jgi:general secretion pathway protein C